MGFDASTHFTSRPGMRASLPSRSALMAAVCCGRPPMVWLVLSSVTTTAMLARLSRSSCRSVGLASAASSAASATARSTAPRVRRTSRSHHQHDATATAPQNKGPGSIGEMSMDQLMRVPSIDPSRSSSAGTCT